MAEITNNTGFTDFTLESISTPSGINQLNSILRQVGDNIAGDTDRVRVFTGIGTPEASVAAGVGSLYMRTDGGADTSVYRKESGSGDTGWIAIKAPASLPLSVANGGTGLDFSATTSGYYLGFTGTGIIGAIAIPQYHGVQLFTSSGTFTAPTGVTKVYLTAVAGGGGGGGGQGGNGSGGGAGQSCINFPFTVVAGNNYTVTIGAAGAAGLSTTDGGDGGTTSFDSISLTGGAKGLKVAGNGGIGGGNAATPLPLFSVAATTATAGTTGAGRFFPGGNGGKGSGTTGGGGGSTPFGSGASGVVNSDGASATANTGAGGAGGASHGGGDQAGGSGGSGFCLVIY